MGGTLYIVATPIGNLKDISLRAIDTLKAVDLIACEDTRRTAILLKAYGVTRPTTSYHAYSGAGKARRLVEEIRGGKRVALVSDAGLPGISDPGTPLVQAAIAEGLPVEVVPGASASLMALVLSGLRTDRFTFEGFLPVKPGPRRKKLASLQGEPRTVILYESPHRLLKTLGDIEETLGDIPMSCSRELTKKFEETRRGRVSDLRAHFTKTPPRGEFVLVFTPRPHGDTWARGHG
ncbi:MAG: 16S rRNA (cytidine(1402)-2'-O)-methyltransferase [Candidatus Omnitrophica bacterium]|nr:16S rRNA (cytidine(1402)-2'-O)-methyltransferase [Candidatus Omnitrophota bacterium]